MMDKAIFCISIDTELVWGRVHMKNIDAFIEKARKERLVIKRLLRLFKQYDVHATWAIVGHLFLTTCTGGQMHPEITRPQYPWLSHDWFAFDPGTNVKESPEWYAPDIVSMINTHFNQEIGSHSFSHFLFNEVGMSREAAKSDMEAWKNASKPFKLGKFFSFVYPQNKIAYTDLLHEYGFRAYRDKDKHWYDKLPKQLEKFFATIDLFLPTSTNNSNVSRDKQLLRIPSSFYFPSGRGFRKFIPQNTRSRKAKVSIDNAIAHNLIFHMWFHPTDLVDDQEKLFSDLEDILKYVLKQRHEGKIKFMNMKEITQSYGY